METRFKWLVGSSWAIGERLIDWHYYYFDTNGYMMTGWRKINGRWKYFDNDGVGTKCINIV